MVRPKNFNIREVIEQLKGSCDDIDSALPDRMDLEDLTNDDYIAIDTEIFQCEQCGWWCEICEQAEDSEICEDCKNDE